MLQELFAQNKDIVINSDIDGFLCGMILQNYYGCRVVGFSDSHDTVWTIPEIEDLDSPIYIDLYVSRPGVVCIEQHIIAYNRELHNQILGYGTKINPNLERERTFLGDMQSDYYHKYPFGTVHYLIALMAREGINVKLPNLSRDINLTYPNTGRQLPTINAGLVITRADDALYSTLVPYRPNALDWWDWLSPQGQYASINVIKDFISSCEIAQADQYKEQINNFFLALQCDEEDGAFLNIVDENGRILPKVLDFLDIISQIFGLHLEIPFDYVTHKGQYGYISITSDYARRVLNGPRIYSYAFIRSPKSKRKNFSYTYDMQ